MQTRRRLPLLVVFIAVFCFWSLGLKAQNGVLNDLQALRYIASHADLIAAFGADADKGRDHYQQYGLKEGRSISFEPLFYTASHPDLIEAFADDELKAVTHYISWGFKENRQTSWTALVALRYLASHPDLIEAFGDDPLAATRHYILWGYKENRAARFSDANALSYIAGYADLIMAFGSDVAAGIRHYISAGYREGRRIIFDALAYIASYGDLIVAFGTDTVAGAKHYIDWGYREGRQVLFDAVGYLATHTDLREAFGDDTAAATRHFINWGSKEGRAYALTIRVNVSGPGSTPQPRVFVNRGERASVMLSTLAGGYLASVSGCGGSLSGEIYTTNPVNASCEINAIFRAAVGDIEGRVTTFDPARPAFVSIVSSADDSVLETTPVDASGGFKFIGLDDRKDYYIKFEQTGYSPLEASVSYGSNRREPKTAKSLLARALGFFGASPSETIKTAAALVQVGDRITFDTAKIPGLSDGQFVYRWEGNPTVSGAEFSSYVPEPITVELIPSKTQIADPQAAIRLSEEYGIILVDPTSTNESASPDQMVWTSEYADRFFQLMKIMPIPVASQGLRSWSKPTYVELVGREIPNDVEIVGEGAYLGGRLRVSAFAFTYATPQLARIEGKRGIFFSNRLFRVVTRIATQDGTRRDVIRDLMKQRYGITVAIDDADPLLITPVTCSSEIPSDCLDAEWRVFKPEEFFDLLSILEEFPEGMRDLSQPGKPIGLRHLLRRRDGIPHPVYPQAPAVAWPESGYAEFMEAGFRGTRNDRHSLIIHEKAHFIWAGMLSSVQRFDWLRLSGWYRVPKLEPGSDVKTLGKCDQWQTNPGTWSPPNVFDSDLEFAGAVGHDNAQSDVASLKRDWASCSTTQFVSVYAAQINPNEDFAESLSAFLLNPDLLRSRALPKYEFIRDRLMQGSIYLSKIRQDLTFEVFNLYPDYTYPGKIKSIEVRAVGGPTEDKKITIRLELHVSSSCGATSGGNCFDGASAAQMRIFSRLNPPTIQDIWLSPVSPQGDVLQGVVSLSKFAAQGWWQVANISVWDKVGNVRVSKQASQDFGWKLYVDNPLEDLQKPRYVSKSITSTLVKPGDRLASSSISGDEQELVTQFRFSESNPAACYARTAFSDPFNNLEKQISKGSFDDYGSVEPLEAGQQDGATHLCTIRHRVTRYWTAGKYHTVFVFVSDTAGNVSTTNFSQDGKDPTLEIAPSVTISSPSSDGVPPILNIDPCRTTDLSEKCLRVQSYPTNPSSPNGETIVDIYYWAYEDQPLVSASGLDGGYINLRDPLGKKFFYYINESAGVVDRRPLRRIDGAYYFSCPKIASPPNCDATTAVQYQLRIILPVGSAPGVWGLSDFSVSDKVSNTRGYDFAELFRFSPTGASMSAESSDSTPFSFDVSRDVRVTSPGVGAVSPQAYRSLGLGARTTGEPNTLTFAGTTLSTVSDILTGSRYEISSRTAAGQGRRTEWQLNYRGSSTTLLGAQRLPDTATLLWRGPAFDAHLPTTAWVRMCGDRVWTVQDGYELIFHVGDRALSELRPGTLLVNSADEATVVADVRCGIGGGLWIEGYAFGVSDNQPPLRRGSQSASWFGFALDRRGSLIKREVKSAPFNLPGLCAAPAAEQQVFCGAVRRAAGWYEQ